MLTKLNEVTDFSFRAIQKGAIDAGVPVLLFFTAAWNAPGKAMIVPLEELQIEYAERMMFFELDTDVCKEVIGKYSIRQVPTALIFKDGKVVGQAAGPATKDKLKSLIAL